MPGETMPRSKLDLLFCELSPGGIYGAFSEFYFDYITVDWTEILLEISKSTEKKWDELL